MPVNQKLDMAIKYGSHNFSKIETAIPLWKQVTKLITKRELLLNELEVFEMTASDPQRFFTKGHAMAELRVAEAEKREKMLRPVHALEAKITELCVKIKDELNESVTFKGNLD